MHALVLGRCRLTLVAEQRFCLVLPRAGEATLWPGEGRRRPALTADAGHSAVLVPPGTFRLRSDRLSVVLIPVSRSALTRAAAVLAGEEAARPLAEERTPWRQWRESEKATGELLGLLRQTLGLLESAAGSNADRASLAGRALASWILQTLALLLLLEPERSGGDGTRAERELRIEALIAHIEANLHRPLSLRELSERSGYSPRSLQYAFQQRFGCGPMQLVRQRRLEAARQALQGASPRDSVAKIARRCGYLNLSSFSRDIQRAFGRPPSALRPGGLWPEAQ
jgi:AraC-like DNA-binding protein